MSSFLCQKLIHDLSTPLSVLLFFQDELPASALEATKRLRYIIDFFRLMLQSKTETLSVINFLKKDSRVSISQDFLLAPQITLLAVYEMLKGDCASVSVSRNRISGGLIKKEYIDIFNNGTDDESSEGILWKLLKEYNPSFSLKLEDASTVLINHRE